MSLVDLGHWADTLIDRYAGQDVIGNALFPITRPTDPSAPPEVEMLPLDRHPVDFLRRYRPPSSCIALGLVSAGWAAPIESRVRPSAHPDAQRILQAIVVTPDGDVAARVRLPDGSIVDPGRGHGRVLDALQAALQLPAA